MESQEEIIEACKKGDRKRQEMLYHQLSPKLFGICLRYASRREEAEDLLQESFIRLFDKISSYRAEGNFEGWAKRLTVNVCLEALRKKNILFQHEDIGNVQYVSSEADLLSDLNIKDLLKAIQDLPDGYRTIFNLYEIESYSHHEIAQKLNISTGTSKSQLARAKQALREKIMNLNKVPQKQEKI